MGAPMGNRNAAGPHKRGIYKTFKREWSTGTTLHTVRVGTTKGKSAKSKLAGLRAKIEKHKNMGPRTKADWRKANAKILKTTMYK